MSENTANSVYQFVIDGGGGLVQSIAMLSPEELKKLEGLTDGSEDSINVRYFRLLNQNSSGLSFNEFMPYSSEHEYRIMKDKIIMYNLASASLADIFISYVHGTTGFVWEKNIPFYNNEVRYQIAN